MQTEQQPILIKCYGRSRLYDPAVPGYVSLEQLRRWQADGVSFRVIDARTGEDMRRDLLG